MAYTFKWLIPMLLVGFGVFGGLWFTIGFADVPVEVLKSGFYENAPLQPGTFRDVTLLVPNAGRNALVNFTQIRAVNYTIPFDTCTTFPDTVISFTI